MSNKYILTHSGGYASANLLAREIARRTSASDVESVIVTSTPTSTDGTYALRWGSTTPSNGSRFTRNSLDVVRTCVDKRASFGVAKEAVRKEALELWVEFPEYQERSLSTIAEQGVGVSGILLRKGLSDSRGRGTYKCHSQDQLERNLTRIAPRDQWGYHTAHITPLVEHLGEIRVLVAYGADRDGGQDYVKFYSKHPIRATPDDPMFSPIWQPSVLMKEVALNFARGWKNSFHYNEDGRVFCIGFDFLLKTRSLVFLEANSAPWIAASDAQGIVTALSKHSDMHFIRGVSETIAHPSEVQEATDETTSSN